MGQGDFNRAKTQCPQRHEYTEENTYINPGGRRWCRKCMRANAKVQCIKKYGISVEGFEVLLEQQHNLCAICCREFKSDHERHIDHNHECCPAPNRSCGKCIRGILCGECNRGLARFKDNSELLKKAADYLDSNKKLGTTYDYTDTSGCKY